MVVPHFNTVGGYPSPRVSGFYSLNAGRNFAFLSRFSWAFICLCRHLHCPVIALSRAHPEYVREQIQTADNNPQAYLRYGNKPPLFLLARLRRFPNRIRRA